jgi:site-specific recombinase XerD
MRLPGRGTDEGVVMEKPDMDFSKMALFDLNAEVFDVGGSSTGRAYARDIRAFSRWYVQTYGEPAKVAALNVDVLTRYRNHCALRISAGTFNRRRTALNHLCVWAVVHGLLQHNPLDQVPCGKWL